MTQSDHFYLCLLRDIPDGTWNTFSLFGMELVAKNEDGQITVAHNRCRHRGARAAHGCGKGKIFCPYHNLPFHFHNPMKVALVGEFVYVGVDDFSPTLSLPLGAEFGSHKTWVRAPFHMWIQNTMDPNHLRTVHADTFARLFDKGGPQNVTISEHESMYSMPVAPDVLKSYAKWGRPDLFDFGFVHASVHPHLSITSFLGHFFSVETAMPSTDPQIPSGTTEITTRFFVAKDSKFPGHMLHLALEHNRKILDEDAMAVTEWARTSDGLSAGIWLPGEERMQAYVNKINRSGLWKFT